MTKELHESGQCRSFSMAMDRIFFSVYYVYKHLVKFRRPKSKNTPVESQEALTGSLVTTSMLCFVKTAEQNKENTSVSLLVRLSQGT